MDQFGLLDLFSELRPVNVLLTQSGNVKLSLSGSAIVTRKPYLELTFPAETWPELQALDQGNELLLCLETEESVFFVNTTMVLAPAEGRLLLHAEDYVQERQKRSADRCQAERIEISYWHLDDEGTRISEEKKAHALDISSTGIRMRVDQIVEPFLMLGMKLVIREAPQATITCTGQIVRMALKADSSIEVAVHFENLDPQSRQRITDYCHREHIVSKES